MVDSAVAPPASASPGRIALRAPLSADLRNAAGAGSFAPGGAACVSPKWPGMHRSYSVAAVLALTVLALSLPSSLAIAASAFAQEPEPPTGEPQPSPTPEEPTPTPEEPTGEQPTGEQPAGETGGQLPRTGWDALLYFILGAALLLAGARLRVLTRIKQVVQRVRRRNTEVALREAL